MTDQLQDYGPYYWVLPTHWSTVMMYGDYTGIEDEDEEQIINSFIHSPDVMGTQCVEVWDDNEFVKYHDAAEFGVLPCDCSTFLFT